MNEQNNNRLGQNLRILRKERQWTQSIAAQKLGISFSTFAKYERGDIKPDTDKLAQIADLFDVSADFLLGKSAVRNANALSNMDQIYFRLAKGAEELGLTEEDVDAILNLYHSHRQKNQ